ncbi:hypothetical protein SBBP1_870002 [Burkholderiales bacterium]|nr:hypothetical protein SBBP1_870002 [Burkholderiales bacterium]
MACFRRATATSRRSAGWRMWRSPAACGASPSRTVRSVGATPLHRASSTASPKRTAFWDGSGIRLHLRLRGRGLFRLSCNERRYRAEFEVLHRSAKVPLDMDDTASSLTKLHFRTAGLVGDADRSEPPAQPVVEVQTNITAREQSSSEWNSSEAWYVNVAGSVQEHDARRCHICGAKFPPFGFGPPLTRPGITLWACGAHRVEIERRLTDAHRSAMCEYKQPNLL